MPIAPPLRWDFMPTSPPCWNFAFMDKISFFVPVSWFLWWIPLPYCCLFHPQVVFSSPLPSSGCCWLSSSSSGPVHFFTSFLYAFGSSMKSLTMFNSKPLKQSPSVSPRLVSENTEAEEPKLGAWGRGEGSGKSWGRGECDQEHRTKFSKNWL